MMGIQQVQNELFSYTVNLDQRVRPDNPLRSIEELIDFTFVRGEVQELYGRNGNESVDPAVIMKMMFLLFFDDVASERELMRIIRERLDYLWFLGYGLDDEIPNHSVLSKARTRWGVEVFETLFTRIVLQCHQAGLIEGGKLHMDGSLVNANASNPSILRGSPELIAQLREQLQSEMNKLDEPSHSSERSKKPGVNRGLLSTTDPDTAVVRKGVEAPRLRYKTHRAVDDAHGVITATRTTSGDVDEAEMLIPLVDDHEKRLPKPVTTVVADSQYGTLDNFAECGKRNIQAHMSDRGANHHDPNVSRGLFTRDMFIYHAQSDTFTCPAGNTMTRCPSRGAQKTIAYTTMKAACRRCPLLRKCHGNTKNPVRVIRRHPDQEFLDIAREQSHSRRAKRDRVRRKWLMEGSFADAANNHGFKRARWRRLWRQSIQDYMIATVQNVRTLVKARNRPQRRAVRALIESFQPCLNKLHTLKAFQNHLSGRPGVFGPLIMSC